MKLPGNMGPIAVSRTSAAYLFTIGFISILGQVVLLRELNVAFFGVELIYTLAIGVWLVFTAFGAMFLRRKPAVSQSQISILFVLLSIALPLGIIFIRSIRLIFSGVPGAFLPLHIQIFSMAVSLFPFGLLLGLLFRASAKAYIAGGKSLAAAYAVESFGGIAGGLCSTFFLKYGLQNFTIGLLCALVAACLSFPFGQTDKAGRLRTLAFIISGLWILCLWNTSMLDHYMTSWTHPNIVTTRDSPYSRITVTRQEKQVAVFENDALLFNTEGIRSEEFVHLSALQHPDPEKILVLGGGIEGTLLQIQDHSPGAIDYVELNPVLLDIARTHLPQEIRKSLDAENVRLIIDDPRRFLKKAPGYDLILANMPEPSSGQANRFYTQEFFRQCSAKLNPGGILTFRLPSSENYASPRMIHRMASVFFAAKSAFSDVMVLPGTTYIFFCSMERLSRDPSLLASRLQSRELETRMVTASYIRYLFTNNRFTETRAALESATAPVNTDTRPICYQYTLMIWLSKFLPGLGGWDLSIFEASNRQTLMIVCLIVFGIPAMLLYRAAWKLRRVFLAGIAGFAGMVLETVLLLRFQIKNGILYQDVGILITSFMIGLTLGAVIIGRRKHPASGWIGVGMIAGFSILSGFIGIEMHYGRSAGLAPTFCFLLLSGFLVAGTFAYASHKEPEAQDKAVAPLYAADLIGGSLGSLLASLVLVPIAGLSLSVLLMIPATILSVFLV